MTHKRKTNLWLFVLAEILAFSMITLVQFVEGWVFVAALLAMHSGIIFFIVSKKGFQKESLPIKGHYQAAYLMLGAYLPILLYKWIITWIGGAPEESIIRIVVIVIGAFAFGGCIINTSLLVKKCTNQ